MLYILIRILEFFELNLFASYANKKKTSLKKPT